MRNLSKVEKNLFSTFALIVDGGMRNRAKINIGD
jgi:hypothetical protein